VDLLYLSQWSGDRTRTDRGLKGISGVHAFLALAKVDSSGRREWLSIASVGKRAPNKDLADRASVDPTFLANARIVSLQRGRSR
jgi:hypothetical protein